MTSLKNFPSGLDFKCNILSNLKPFERANEIDPSTCNSKLASVEVKNSKNQVRNYKRQTDPSLEKLFLKMSWPKKSITIFQLVHNKIKALFKTHLPLWQILLKKVLKWRSISPQKYTKLISWLAWIPNLLAHFINKCFCLFTNERRENLKKKPWI